MKKFEENLKEKAHQSKIRNAKKTIPVSGRRSDAGGKSSFERISEEAKLLLSLYDNKSYNAIPAYKLLRTQGLQQYTRGFIMRGYGINLGKLGLIGDEQRQKLYEDLKVLPGHSVKLDKLIDILAKNSYSTDLDREMSSDKSVSQVSRTSVVNSKGEYQYRENFQYQQQQRVMREYSPLEVKKKATFHSKVSEKTSIANNRQKYAKTNYPGNYSKNNDFSKKPPGSSKPTVKKANIASKASEKTIEQPAKKSLNKLLKQVSPGSTIDSKKVLTIDLQIDKVKSLYRSFDGALMSSTIVNIDLQELIYSFAGYIFSKVIAATVPKQENNPIPNQNKTKTIEQSQTNLDRDDIEDQIGEILRESYMHPLYREEQAVRQELDGDQVLSEGDSQPQPISQYQFAAENKILESSFFGGQSYDFEISQPLRIFDEPEPSEIDYFKPTVDSIFNFIKNVVLAAKMQREIPIMAANYMGTFLFKSKIPLTSINYKRMLVSNLLLASKIWDDESFESPSFSKTFPQYSTVLLNQMEKQILNQLDYKLKLNKTEYAKTFFELRKHRKATYKSYQNRNLTMHKIRELQEGVKKEYKTQYMVKRPSF